MNEIFDRQDAMEKTAGDINLMGQVIRFTLDDFPGILADLREALGNQQWSDAGRLAHKLKGSAGASGARKLYLAALELELATETVIQIALRSSMASSMPSKSSESIRRLLKSLQTSLTICLGMPLKDGTTHHGGIASCEFRARGIAPRQSAHLFCCFSQPACLIRAPWQ